MKGLESSSPESMLPLCCPLRGHTGDPLQNMTLLAPISDLQPLGLRDQSAWGLSHPVYGICYGCQAKAPEHTIILRSCKHTLAWVGDS